MPALVGARLLLLGHRHCKEVLIGRPRLESFRIGESFIRKELHVGCNFRQHLCYGLLVVFFLDFVGEHRYLHTLVDVARMLLVYRLEAGPVRHWVEGLSLCGRHNTPMNLRRRKERLNVVLLDHGAAMHGHADDARYGILFLHAQVECAVSTRHYGGLLHVFQV